jgi:SHS2 domain-containing protein
MPWEQLDHTADIRIRVTAVSLVELFSHACIALNDLMGGDYRESPSIHEFKVEAKDPEELLMGILREQLYLKHTKHFNAVDVTFLGPMSGEYMCRLYGYNEPTQGEEIKAVTYHNFHITKTDEGYEAEIIFDI